MDAYNASIAAKGPRAFPPPGPNAGRWEQQAGVREPTRHGPDVHAGRHEDRAFYGDGGDRNVWVPFDVRDAQHGFARHAGRWEERAKWRDAPYLDSQKFVNHGHYAQHIGRDNWERGAYLRQDRGVHEGRWRDGVWDEGLWQRRAGWAHAPTRKRAVLPLYCLDTAEISPVLAARGDRCAARGAWRVSRNEPSQNPNMARVKYPS